MECWNYCEVTTPPLGLSLKDLQACFFCVLFHFQQVKDRSCAEHLGKDRQSPPPPPPSPLGPGLQPFPPPQALISSPEDWDALPPLSPLWFSACELWLSCPPPCNHSTPSLQLRVTLGPPPKTPAPYLGLDNSGQWTGRSRGSPLSPNG